MADLSELPLHTRLELALYKWRRIEPVPWTPLAVPLRHARVALVTSAGLYELGEDEPFRRMKGGDYSFRILSADIDVHRFVLGQTAGGFDREPIVKDRNLALPVEPLAELVREHVVGSAASVHVSFNGSITAPKRLMTETAPRVVERLQEDGVHAAVFIPVCAMCTQSVALLAAVIEAHGISTTCLALLREVAEQVRPPRALAVPFPFGAPLGAPNDLPGQTSVLRQALRLLEEPGPPPVLRDYRPER